MKHTVVVSAEQMAQIREDAAAAYPAECCGILIGLARDSTVLISSLHATENRWAARACDRYEVDPREILRLDRSAESQGKKVIGFYHSHPDHPPLPSPTDLRYAWPGYVYLIVATTGTSETAVRAWKYDERLRRFRECAIQTGGETTPARPQARHRQRKTKRRCTPCQSK